MAYVESAHNDIKIKLLSTNYDAFERIGLLIIFGIYPLARWVAPLNEITIFWH